MAKNPCLNNGFCLAELNNDEFKCNCPANVKGKYCEIGKTKRLTKYLKNYNNNNNIPVQEEIPSIKFNGATFLQYKNRGYRR